MYAIIESGGKQHKVFEGEVLRLEKLEAAAGDTVNFDKVLMVAMDDQVTFGAPYVDNTQVTAEVLEQGRADKIRIVKFKRRKHHQKEIGHRQYFTEVKITGIATGTKVKASAKATAVEADAGEVKAKPAAKAEAKPAAKAAAKKPAAKKAAASKSKSTTKTAAKKAGQDKTEE